MMYPSLMVNPVLDNTANIDYATTDIAAEMNDTNSNTFMNLSAAAVSRVVDNFDLMTPMVATPTLIGGDSSNNNAMKNEGTQFPKTMEKVPKLNELANIVAAAPATPPSTIVTTTSTKLRVGCLNPPQHVVVESLSNAGDSHQWMAHWYEVGYRSRWRVAAPKFKNCKAKVEEFDASFSNTWYKAPYKYHMLLDVDGVSPSDSITATLTLAFENGEVLPASAVKQNSAMFALAHFSNEDDDTRDEESRFQSTVGPFQFNVCSYKEEGRRFRMRIELRDDSNNKLIAVLISTIFVIRAKKKPVRPRSRARPKSPDMIEKPASKKMRTSVSDVVSGPPRNIVDLFREQTESARQTTLLNLMKVMTPADRAFLSKKLSPPPSVMAPQFPLSSSQQQPQQQVVAPSMNYMMDAGVLAGQPMDFFSLSSFDF